MKTFAKMMLSTLTAGSMVSLDASSANAATLTYPALNASFPSCTTTDQEFCVESLSFTPDGGTPTQVTEPATSSQSDTSKPYLNAGFFFSAYTGPSTNADGTGLLPTMNANLFNNSGFPRSAAIRDGLAEGTYTYRLRTGDFDPTYVVIQGDWINHTVEKGADGYFTLEVTARPLTFLSVSSNIGKCLASNWKTDCEGETATRRWLGGAFVMHGNAQTRDVSRGTAISTTASYIRPSAPAANGPEAKQKLTVAGPHFVPDGFLTSGKTENGRYLNPAVYKMYLPYAATVRSLALANITTTEDGIKKYLADPKNSIYSGTIVNEAGITVKKDLTVTAMEKGVLVNFNLDTFSAPNPTLYMSNPDRVRTTATSGAAISPLRAVKKGQKVSRTTLLGASPGTKIGTTTSKSPKVCSIAGSTVRALKAGTCNLSVTISTMSGGKAVLSKVNVSVTVK